MGDDVMMYFSFDLISKKVIPSLENQKSAGTNLTYEMFEKLIIIYVCEYI